MICLLGIDLKVLFRECHLERMKPVLCSRHVFVTTVCVLCVFMDKGGLKFVVAKGHVSQADTIVLGSANMHTF